MLAKKSGQELQRWTPVVSLLDDSYFSLLHSVTTFGTQILFPLQFSIKILLGLLKMITRISPRFAGV